jgi:tripartite-type tricarboxylate transporter receptor subunit TctC
LLHRVKASVGTKTMQFPNVKERLETIGMESMPLTPAEFDAHVWAELARPGRLSGRRALNRTNSPWSD